MYELILFIALLSSLIGSALDLYGDYAKQLAARREKLQARKMAAVQVRAAVAT
ncbi:MAG: hypothetical protein AAGF74_17040 [Pseudomonadota bacterium]